MEAEKKSVKSKYYDSSGSVVRFLRTCRGLSQQELTEYCKGKIRLIDVGRIEHGDFNMRIGKVCAIPSFLGISLDAVVRNDFSMIGDSIPEETPEMCRSRKKQRQKTQARKDAAGEFGQKLVVEWERERLRGIGMEHLVRAAFADDESAGFDVFSFTEEGIPLFIEVKSSVNGEDQFFMTENERCFAQYCLENNQTYKLYSIKYVFDRKKRRCHVYTAGEVLSLPFINYDYIIKERRSS